MTNSPALETPVLFIVFKRLETTQAVFEAIRNAKPPKLYIASDGPRAQVEGELQQVNAVRDFLMANITWDCEIMTLFSPVNQGCKIGVSTALDWFFQNEEMGIVLEDDCVPHQSFFHYCEELLKRYRFDSRVGHISGNNFHRDTAYGDADYFFSNYAHSWGWASWADRWANYDVNLNKITSTKFIDQLPLDPKTKKYWKSVYYKMKKNKIDTWDYQWQFTLWNNNFCSICPNTNLIGNIGFGIDATHTVEKTEFNDIPTYNLKLTKHPENFKVHHEADILISKKIFRHPSWLNRLLKRIY